jgi:hypothetical protein
MPRYATLFVALLALASSASTRAQSDPSNFDTVINVPGDPVPSQIGSNTQLNLSEGGAVPHSFTAGGPAGATSNIEINISGGTIAPLARFLSGTGVNVSGGTIGVDSIFADGSEVNMTGGRIEKRMRIAQQATVYLQGGTIADELGIQGGGRLVVSGGALGQNVAFYSIADVEILGGEFQLNGTPYTASSITLGPTDIFTGTLADGSSFLFTPIVDEAFQVVQLTPVSLPALDTTPIVVGPETTGQPSGLRAGQTLTVIEGGSLGDYTAIAGGILNVEGGNAGDGIEVAYGTLNIQGGTAGRIAVFDEGVVHIAGGTVTGGINTYSGSQLNITGGTVGNTGTGASGVHLRTGSQVFVTGGNVVGPVVVETGAALNVSGGSVNLYLLSAWSELNVSGGEVRLHEAHFGVEVSLSGGILGRYSDFGGILEMTGGELGPYVSLDYGAIGNISGGTLGRGFAANTGSDVELIGDDFKLNGVEFTDSSVLFDNKLDINTVFTGTLADGSPFIFTRRDQDTLINVKLTRATLPAIDTTPIVVDSSSAPNGLRTGQTLTLRSGGALGNNFAMLDAAVRIEGGSVGEGLELSRSQVDVRGGQVGDYLRATQGSQVNVSDGEIGRAQIDLASTLNMSGGSIAQLTATSQSTLNLSGGTIEWDLVVLDSTLNLFGSNFQINGVPIEDLELSETETIEVTHGMQLTATLADGSVFDRRLTTDSRANFLGTLTVTLTLPGDFNGDAVVDLADYTVWRDNLGSAASLPGDLTPGTVTQDDYDLWKSHFGEVFTPAAPVIAVQVPEPAAAFLLLGGLASCLLAARRREPVPAEHR